MYPQKIQTVATVDLLCSIYPLIPNIVKDPKKIFQRPLPSKIYKNPKFFLVISGLNSQIINKAAKNLLYYQIIKKTKTIYFFIFKDLYIMKRKTKKS